MDGTITLQQIRSIFQEEMQALLTTQMRNVVREEIQEVVGEEIGKLTDHLQKTEFQPVRTQLKKMDRKLEKVQKDLDFIVCEFVERVNSLEKRTRRVETHLGLHSTG